jgi:signal transduction histidine kinase
MNNERVTLAQELHDGIAQDLVVLGFSIDQAISLSQEAEVKSELRAIRFTTTQLIEKLRKQMHQLRSGDPLHDSSTHVDTMHETLRIVQEILRNIEKH